ncbi:DUF5131 family protein [Bosea massiliensis]|uniref:DUF5131 family protein n=1 Tax=Bosea massiliensis TaxID=151419 RepID=A0ABW0NY89_9HYPH
MAERTGIEWTDATVNFWWGCTKVGPGCDHCYAETWAGRFGGGLWGVGAPRRKIKGAAAMLNRLDNDYAWWAADAEIGGYHPNSRRRVFIQSMSDLFDTEVPIEWFAEAWGKIVQCNRLDIQIVTKRISVVEKRLAAIGVTTWPKHAGLLVTVCNQDEAGRDIPRLLALKAKLGIPWVGVSAEPLLGPIDFGAWLCGSYECATECGWRSGSAPDREVCHACGLTSTSFGEFCACGAQDFGHICPNCESNAVQHHPDTTFLDWVIVGGESGPNARPMHPDWARSIRDQCATAGTAFFFKQWGEWAPSETARPPKGKLAVFCRDGQLLRGQAMATGRIDDAGAEIIAQFGKARAGRLLDGVTHDAMPEVRHG